MVEGDQEYYHDSVQNAESDETLIFKGKGCGVSLQHVVQLQESRHDQRTHQISESLWNQRCSEVSMGEVVEFAGKLISECDRKEELGYEQVERICLGGVLGDEIQEGSCES